MPSRSIKPSLDANRMLGAERSEGRGSRVRFLLKGTEAVFHRPHPRPDTDKGAVAAVRRFLESAGVNHDPQARRLRR